MARAAIDPSLGKLYTEIPTPPPEVSKATALIAATEPVVLDEALKPVLASDIAAGIAEDRLTATATNPGSSPSDLARARRIVGKTARSQHVREVELGKVGTTPAFAHEVVARRRQLSRPMRWAATLLCTAAAGIGAGGLTYTSAEMSSRNHKPDGGQLVETGVIGAGGLVGGALAGTFLGEGLAGRTARRRARKIVRNAQQGQV